MPHKIVAPPTRQDVQLPEHVLEEAHVREARRLRAIAEHVEEYEGRHGAITKEEIDAMRRRLAR